MKSFVLLLALAGCCLASPAPQDNNANDNSAGDDKSANAPVATNIMAANNNNPAMWRNNGFGQQQQPQYGLPQQGAGMQTYYTPQGGFGAVVNPAGPQGPNMYWQGPRGFNVAAQSGYMNQGYYGRPSYQQPQVSVGWNNPNEGLSSGVTALPDNSWQQPPQNSWNSNGYYPGQLQQQQWYGNQPQQTPNQWYGPSQAWNNWQQPQPQQQPNWNVQLQTQVQGPRNEWTVTANNNADDKKDGGVTALPAANFGQQWQQGWTPGAANWRRSYTPLPGRQGCYNRCKPSCGLGGPGFGCKPSCNSACNVRPSCGRRGPVQWAGNTMVCGRQNAWRNNNGNNWNNGNGFNQWAGNTNMAYTAQAAPAATASQPAQQANSAAAAADQEKMQNDEAAFDDDESEE